MTQYVVTWLFREREIMGKVSTYSILTAKEVVLVLKQHRLIDRAKELDIINHIKYSNMVRFKRMIMFIPEVTINSADCSEILGARFNVRIRKQKDRCNSIW